MHEWSIVLVSLVSASLSSWLTFRFTSWAKRDESIIRFKEEKYAKRLVKLQGFVGTTASTQLKREFFEEQYQSWLYASDDVVLQINALVRLVQENQNTPSDPEVNLKTVGDVVLAMRRDLLKKTNLDYKAFRYTDVHDAKRG